MTALKLKIDERGVATLSLSRPEKHNALSAAMISEVTQAAKSLGENPAVRVVILTGEGASFCAGGDLDWMREQIAATAETRAMAASQLAEMLRALNEMPKPLIGAVQGNSFGGGVGLACVCDVTLGVTSARFGLTETRLGLIPATIGPYVVARLGEAMARRVFMSARIFDAQEAVTLGILARAVAPEALPSAIEAEVRPYLDCAPGAVAAAKALVRTLGPVIDKATIALSIAALIKQWESAESTEGIAAFFDKRPPSWKVS